MIPPLTLASKSTARRAVLDSAGVTYEATGSGVDEDVLKATLLAQGADPRRIAEVLAEQKALAVSVKRPGLVIGADQTLDLDGKLYDKVDTVGAARDRLRELRGREHQLHSAVVVTEGDRTVWRTLESATLVMRPFSDAFLDAYLATEGPNALGSVGCYRLEGPGVQLFERIDGDYFTILGLPILGLFDLLRGHGMLAS